MGDATGPTIVDSKGTSNATAANGPVFGAAGGVPGDSNTAITFDGVNDSARANLNLSGTSAVTVEFWLKWNRYADDDALAMEFTDNFNGSDGGFLVDPERAAAGRDVRCRARALRLAQQRLLPAAHRRRVAPLHVRPRHRGARARRRSRRMSTARRSRTRSSTVVRAAGRSPTQR